MSKVDNFIDRLEGVRTNRSTNSSVLRAFRAFCPVHQADGRKPGRTPSLSIAESMSGNVLMHCHAGCSPDEIVSAVGMSLDDLFPESDSSRDMSTEELHSSGPVGEWRGLSALVDKINDKSHDLMWAASGVSGKTIEQMMEIQVDLTVALQKLKAHAKAMMREERKRSAPAPKGGA